MRVDEAIARRLAWTYAQRSGNGMITSRVPAESISEADYWDLILTDSVRETYLVMATSAIEIIRRDDEAWRGQA